MVEQAPHSPSPAGFVIPALSVAVLAFAMMVWVASREWFYGDDFIFLKLAQMQRDWWKVFAPLEPRLWWSYRPLTIEVFFSTFFALYGFHAFPYLLFVIAVHFASGFVLFRIAMRLGFTLRAACFAGCLMVLMYPSVHELFWASALQPVGAIFFYLVSVSCFLAHLDTRRPGWLLASIAAQILTLLSNELGATLPGVLGVLAMWHAQGGVVARVLETARRIWPHALLLGAYLYFRFELLAPPLLDAPAFYYAPRVGWHVLRNLGSYAWLLTHEHWLHAAVAALLFAAGWLAAIGSRSTVGTLARRTLLALAWSVVAMTPFLGIWFAQHRMVMAIEAPFCLLIAAHLDAVWARWGQTHGRQIEWAMVLILAAAVPYQTIWERGTAPLGALNLRIVELMREQYPEPPTGTCFSLHAVEPENWNRGHLFAVWFVSSGLLSAVYADHGIELRNPNPKTLSEEPPPHCGVIEVLSRTEVRFGRPPQAPAVPPRR